jgi:site-specific recombinase XerD
MVPKRLSTAKKAPTLKDSRFHINNTSQSIKALQRYQEKGIITDDDAHLIDEYLVKRRADKDLSQARVTKLLWTLLSWRRFVPPFRQNTITDIYKGIDAVKNGTQKGPRDPTSHYSKNYVYDTVTIVKPFYLWMIEAGYSNLKDKDILALKRPKRDLMTKTVADILTEEEIKKMVQACESTRDRAILMLLYDGGFGIVELGKLTWGQILFDTYGAVVNVDEKTGKPRYVRLLAATPYLAKWKDDYPFEPNGNNLVFVTHQKKALSYNPVYRQIRRIAERAGIQKNVHPHIFRHTRITNLIEKGIPESVIKSMMWGSLTTDMFACYAHLSNHSIDNALLEQAGIKRAEPTEKNDALAPKQCLRCFTICGPTQQFCGSCGMPLTDSAALDQKQVMDELTKLMASFTPEQLKALQKLSTQPK